MRTIVLDTNVLLANPDTLLSFPEDEVIIPETVLGEIDKLKTQRVDPDLRFRGRQVSRMLFELSENGRLVDGVELPNGGTVRVVPLSSDIELPDGLTGRNADDRILAVAYQVCNQGCQDLLLVTNDLNMLLKAQALGISVERRAELEGGWTRKYIVRPFQRYRVPLTILAIALAVFAGVLALAYYTTTISGGGNCAGVPTEFRDQLSEPYRNLLDGLIALQNNGTDAVALAQVGNAYYGLQSQTGNVSFAQKAISYYERYLNIRSDDTDVRTDMAAMFFYSGATDRAIQEATTVLQTDPNHVNANFNLGIFYWKGRSDFKAAALQFKKVIELTKDGDAHTQIIAEQAKVNLIAVVAEAKAAGQELDADTLGIREYLGGTI
jgi:tetratricopeptide (TPR) repeat protein